VNGKSELLWDLRLRSLRKTFALVLSGHFEAPHEGDGVMPDGLLTEPAWLPDFFGVDGYTELVNLLQPRLEVHQLLTFAYDWRYSNAHTARLLDEEIRPALAEWQSGPGGPGSKLILICHSMGGLVARYFCEHLGGAALTRRIVTFGTPHRGALKALYALSGEMKIAPFISARSIAGAWPSVWEMLPQYPCLRDANGRFVRLADSTLDLARDPRFAGARDFQQAIRVPAEARAKAGERAYDQVVFFGRVQTTLQYAKVWGSSIKPIAPGADGVPDRGGDGTVPSFASMPIEWDSSEDALPLLDKHAALATRQSAIEYLLNRLDPAHLSGDKRPGLEHVFDVIAGTEPEGERPEPEPALGAADLDGEAHALNVPQVVDVTEQVTVDVIHPKAGSMMLEIFDHERDRVWDAQARFTTETEARGYILRAELGTLPPGTYTVRTRAPVAVADHLLVWSDSMAAAKMEAQS
jgi:pimeloyl-ACP methyl ester carboxylesterase